MDSVRALLLSPATEGLRPFQRLLRAMALGRSRRRLGQLDDHLLRDIGLDRSEARFEAERTSWNAPAHWLR